MRNLRHVFLSILFCLIPAVVLAGDLEAPAAPTEPGSAMYTLADIYNRLNNGTEGAKRTGPFIEPISGPDSTGHTLDEVMGKAPSVDDVAGAGAAEVLAGMTFWGLTGGTWGTQTGTMPDREGDHVSTAQTPSGGINYFTAPEGYYDGDDRVSATDAQVGGLDANLSSANIRSTVTIFGVAGDTNVVNTGSGDAAAGDMLSGKKAWADGVEVTGSVPAGANVSGAEGLKTFSIPNGLYSGSETATANDTDLTGANIKKDVDILGVTGTYEGGAGFPAEVPKTGQTTSHATGDDGDLQRGVVWPNPRFTNNGNGTVTDNLTGLMWARNANIFGAKSSWANALAECNDLTLGGHNDWRLPNVKELQSLIDFAFYSPALSNAAGTGKWSEGNAFTGVQSAFYWSSTTYAGYMTLAWYVHLGSVFVYGDYKTSTHSVWPVRGGQ